MPRTCSVCADSRRAEVDQALVSGVAVDELSRRYPPLSATSIRRHRAEHLPATLAKAHEAGEVARAGDLLGQVRQLRGKAISILLQAERAGDLRTALMGVREARACVELLAEMEGELNRSQTVNVLIASPHWLETRNSLIAALRPFPEARAAVVAALLKLESANE